MKELFHEPGFWTFMAALVGALKYRYVLKSKAIDKQATAEMSVERFRATQIGRVFEGVEKNVAKLSEITKEQAVKWERFGASVEQVKQVESNMVGMMKDLKIQYGEFKTARERADTGRSIIFDEITKLKSDVIDLKNGRVLIKGRKQ